jgi:hypothetical protein
LIDADDTSPSGLQGLLSEVSKFGIANIKRIYGDWTTPNLGAWKAWLLEYSIHPIQQFRYTVEKNSTDSAMIIDAMDLLHVGHLDAFSTGRGIRGGDARRRAGRCKIKRTGCGTKRSAMSFYFQKGKVTRFDIQDAS